MVLLICSVVMTGSGFLNRWTANQQKTKRAQTFWAIYALVCWGVALVEIVLGVIQLVMTS